LRIDCGGQLGVFRQVFARWIMINSSPQMTNWPNAKKSVRIAFAAIVRFPQLWKTQFNYVFSIFYCAA
jgi:hypothetical protein